MNKRMCAVSVTALIGVILMITTTAEFQTAISASSRQIKARCAVAYTYPFIRNNIASVSTTTAHADSDAKRLTESDCLIITTTESSQGLNPMR
jgi:hypothetical protein